MWTAWLGDAGSAGIASASMTRTIPTTIAPAATTYVPPGAATAYVPTVIATPVARMLKPTTSALRRVTEPSYVRDERNHPALTSSFVETR